MRDANRAIAQLGKAEGPGRVGKRAPKKARETLGGYLGTLRTGCLRRPDPSLAADLRAHAVAVVADLRACETGECEPRQGGTYTRGIPKSSAGASLICSLTRDRLRKRGSQLKNGLRVGYGGPLVVFCVASGSGDPPCADRATVEPLCT